MAFCAWCGNQVPQVSYVPCPRCGNPTNGAQRAAASSSGGANTAGLVIGIFAALLVVVAVVGVLAAIAIPNFMTAMQRSKQKRTMADVRSIGTALEAYATDKNEYPRVASISELSAALTPTYLKVLPGQDGWGTEMRYECWPADEACNSYAVGSAGADKIWEQESLGDYQEGSVTTKFDADIVYANGQFVQFPEGAQSQ